MIPLLKKTILILVISSAAIAQTPKPTINDLSWLSGCWEASRKGREISEQWMKPSGRMMLGMGRMNSMQVANADGMRRSLEYAGIWKRPRQSPPKIRDLIKPQNYQWPALPESPL